MPRRPRGWRLALTLKGWVLVRGGEVITDAERIRDIVTACPKCGRRATSFYVTKTGYVYAWHPAGHSRKHQWCVGPKSDFVLSLLSGVKARVTEEEKNLVARVFLRGESVGEEERERARSALAKLLGLQCERFG
jgi:hypothetical protein